MMLWWLALTLAGFLGACVGVALAFALAHWLEAPPGPACPRCQHPSDRVLAITCSACLEEQAGQLPPLHV